MNVIEPLHDGPPDPSMWEPPEIQAAIAERDFGRVYQRLQRIGYAQHRIAALTGQSQGEVSAVIHGRKVMRIDVVERIVRGLNIPPHLAGLAYSTCTTAGTPPHTTPADTTPPHATPAAAHTTPPGGCRTNRRGTGRRPAPGHGLTPPGPAGDAHLEAEITPLGGSPCASPASEAN